MASCDQTLQRELGSFIAANQVFKISSDCTNADGLIKLLLMQRPVDVFLEFLEAEKARGISHVHLDEGARSSLRELHGQTKGEKKSPADLSKIEAPPAKIEPAATSSRVEALTALRRQAETWAPARALGTLREKMVFSTGNPEPRVMLIGEAPGYQEEKEGEPFVGPAGQKLNEILKAMGMSREEVYLSNIVKFRPATANQATNNRKPTPQEMAVCMPFIKAEIEIIKPFLIIALGGTAAEGLLGLSGTVTAMRGGWHDFEGIPVRVSYHPSYLLQSGGGNQTKRLLWEDMLAVLEKLNLPISEKQRGFFLPKE